MNELPAVGPENLGYARRFGGQSPLIQTMASDLFPVSIMDWGMIDPELLALQGARMRASQSATAAAVAARFSAVGLANPANSGVIGVLELGSIICGVAWQVRRQAAAVSALQASAQGVALDSRITESASLRLITTDEAALANYGTNFATYVHPSTESRDVAIPFVLAPLSTVWFVAATVNTAITGSVRWRQRKIEDGEISPV